MARLCGRLEKCACILNSICYRCFFNSQHFKVFKTPEVARVYIGTFWDHQLHYDTNRRLFQDEQHDLFADLQSLPRNAALRKLNDLIKRARLAKVHAYIIAELRKQMPSMIGKEKKKKELIQNLDKIFDQLQVSEL